MSDYTNPPNENWLQENRGETILLQFPHGQYAVTVHGDEETEQLLRDTGAGGVPADD